MTVAAVSLWVQMVLVALQGAWLAFAAINNLRHAAHNRDSVVAVLAMRWLEEDAPDVYTAYQHRRWTSASVHAVVFRALVLAECCVALVLLAAALALFAAGLGWIPAGPACTLAVAGSLGFTALWGAFLAGGEWFVYHATPRTPQSTHFCLLLWGVGTLAVLT